MIRVFNVQYGTGEPPGSMPYEQRAMLEAKLHELWVRYLDANGEPKDTEAFWNYLLLES